MAANPREIPSSPAPAATPSLSAGTAPTPVAKPSFRTWEEIRNLPEVEHLDNGQLDDLRAKYFVDVVAPHFGEDQFDAAWEDFDRQTKPSMLSSGLRTARRGLEALGRGVSEGLDSAGLGQPKGVEAEARGQATRAGLKRMFAPTLDDLYLKHGTEQGVDPELLRGIADAETGHIQDYQKRIKAVSPKGAAGLMQFMPATAARFKVFDPSNPDQAVGGAARYLRTLLDRYGGNKELAVAAYNAGEGTVDDFLNGTNKTGKNPKLARTGGIPPFAETQAYVPKVLGSKRSRMSPEMYGLPVTPEGMDRERQLFDEATPAQRAQVAAGDDWRGRIWRDLSGQREEIGQVTRHDPALQAATDDTVEGRALSYRLQMPGMDPKESTRRALEDIVFNRPSVVDSTIGSTDFDFDRAAELRKAGPLRRGLEQGWTGLKQQGAGLNLLAADLAGGLGVPGAAGYGRAQEKARAGLRLRELEMGENPNDFNRHLEGAIASTVSNAPALAAGLLTGGSAGPLLGMGAQVVGDEYASGLEAGKSGPEAFGRALAFGAAEILGERLGFRDSVDMLKRAAGGNAAEFERLFVKNMGEQIAGEQVTTAAQFAIDKHPQYGLNPEATAQDYFKQVKDTLFQTVLQTAMMGTPGGVRAAHDQADEGMARDVQRDTPQVPSWFRGGRMAGGLQGADRPESTPGAAPGLEMANPPNGAGPVVQPGTSAPVAMDAPAPGAAPDPLAGLSPEDRAAAEAISAEEIPAPDPEAATKDLLDAGKPPARKGRPLPPEDIAKKIQPGDILNDQDGRPFETAEQARTVQAGRNLAGHGVKQLAKGAYVLRPPETRPVSVDGVDLAPAPGAEPEFGPLSKWRPTHTLADGTGVRPLSDSEGEPVPRAWFDDNGEIHRDVDAVPVASAKSAPGAAQTPPGTAASPVVPGVGGAGQPEGKAPAPASTTSAQKPPEPAGSPAVPGVGKVDEQAGKPAAFTPTHVLADGTPVVAARDGQGNPRLFRWLTADGLERVGAAKKIAPAPARPAKRHPDLTVDPKTDSILAAIAKAGGVSVHEAKRQGIDPAYLNRRGHKIFHVFTKNGATFDDMAHNHLSPHGYPVTGANDLLEAMGRELRGQPVYTPQGDETAAGRKAQDREDSRAQTARQDAGRDPFDSDHAPGFDLEEDAYAPGMDAYGRRVYELAHQLSALDENFAEDILERAAIQEWSNEDTAGELEAAIASRTRTAEVPGGQGQGLQTEAQGTGFLDPEKPPAQVKPAAAPDLFAPASPEDRARADALAVREAGADKARQRNANGAAGFGALDAVDNRQGGLPVETVAAPAKPATQTPRINVETPSVPPVAETQTASQEPVAPVAETPPAPAGGGAGGLEQARQRRARAREIGDKLRRLAESQSDRHVGNQLNEAATFASAGNISDAQTSAALALPAYRSSSLGDAIREIFSDQSPKERNAPSETAAEAGPVRPIPEPGTGSAAGQPPQAQEPAAARDGVAPGGDAGTGGPVAAEPAPAHPPEWGAGNVLVSRERAAELRERLKKKLGQLNAGVDPEMIALGVELAAFHIEAGARTFGEFARTMARDLGVPVVSLRPYLRSWYNGARDMIEDHGLSVEGTDDAERVKVEVKRLFGGGAMDNKLAAPPAPSVGATAREGSLSTPADNGGLRKRIQAHRDLREKVRKCLGMAA